MNVTMPKDLGAKKDPLGHGLWRARMEAAAGLAEAVAAQPFAGWPAVAFARPWVVTGIGSSEAQGRLLVHLLNTRGGPTAQFLPLASFLAKPPACVRGKFLVIITQGLSPNSRPALAAASAAAGAALFTATTPAGARAAGKPDRAAALEAWVAAGHTLLPLWPEEEYAILIRVLGPMAGTVAMIQAAAAALPKRALPGTPVNLAATLPKAGGSVLASVPSLLSNLDRPLLMLAGPDVASYGQNLAYKFLEGLFLPQPPLVDWLQFAHGPFQQRCADRGPVVVLLGTSPVDKAAWARAQPMLTEVARPLIVLKASLPPPWDLLEHEVALNRLIIPVAEHLASPQRQWPGQGQDGPLYGWGQED